MTQQTAQSCRVILVVEDERPLQNVIRFKLTKNNFDVITASSVEQAKEFVNSLEHIDAIWLDHYLIGKEDGLDFVAWCKRPGRTKAKHIPIFVVSNTASPDKVSTYMRLGAKEYFVKANHRLEEIINAINEHI